MTDLNQSTQIFLLLLLVSGQHDGHRAQSVCFDGCEDAGAAVSDLLRDETPVQGSQAQTAVLGGNVTVHQAKFVSLLDDWPRKFASLDKIWYC